MPKRFRSDEEQKKYENFILLQAGMQELPELARDTFMLKTSKLKHSPRSKQQ